MSWVRSLVPNEKNSAYSAIFWAMSAARGTSIMVPTRYRTGTPISAITPSATRRVCSNVSFISPTVPVSGIMISGSTRTPCSAAVHAASMMARTCMP